jgi:hypothetical protein
MRRAKASSPTLTAMTWLVYQVAFQNASIGTSVGFADLARIDIRQVPTPGAIALLGLASLGARRRR